LSATVARGPIAREVFGTTFQNPVLLAAGTCGFGLELAEVLDLEALGGFVTKSVTVEPRAGNPRPRVAELPQGMINSVGLANPGLEAVRREKLPWIRHNTRRAKVFISVAGHIAEDYERVVAALDPEDGFLGFELNLSCPNDRNRGGRPFVLDPTALVKVIELCRARTQRPLLAKLAPHDPDLERTVEAAERAGADGLTLVNTLPGLALREETGRPVLGAGEGGMSGPALRPAGVRAVQVARKVSPLPLVGVGGIGSAKDALEYLMSGACLVQVGTASFARPRSAQIIVEQLERWSRTGRIPDWRAPFAPSPGGSASVEGPRTAERAVWVAREARWQK
jgi:dihydroorotate dehydrogenase (NAD+) catalytic subunit